MLIVRLMSARVMASTPEGRIDPSRKRSFALALARPSCVCILDNALNDTTLVIFFGSIYAVQVVSSSFTIVLYA
jgi:hypothetical protein